MKKDEETNRQKKIYQTQKIIEEWQNELDTMAVCENLQPQIDAVNIELRELQEERVNIDNDISDLRAEKTNQEREEKSKLLEVFLSIYFTILMTVQNLLTLL